MTENGISAATQVLHLAFENNPDIKVSQQALSEIISNADGIFEDEHAIMKSAKKDDEDGLHYSVEKLVDDLVQGRLRDILDREVKKK